MKNASPDERQRLLRLEGLLTALLRYGALVASGWIALGMALGMSKGIFPLVHALSAISDRCIAIGIVLLIALPVLRVALMTGVFWFEKDYSFAAISGAVLLIITLGFLAGTIHRPGDPVRDTAAIGTKAHHDSRISYPYGSPDGRKPRGRS
jgi:Protein of unknown function (DUF1634)